MSLYLHTSNKTENLLKVLIDQMKNDDPLSKRVIVTSGKGMQNWLKFEISKLLGVSANLHFFTIEKIIWQLAKASLSNSNYSQSNPFSKERIAWKVRHVLSEITADYPSEFELVQSYIEIDDPLKKIQFCWEVATVFDGYLHYRPDLIEKWDNGQIDYQNIDATWQALLWRRISSELPCPPISTLCNENLFASQGPKSIYFFGFSPTPKVYVQALAKYSEKNNLHLFCIQPTDGYWNNVLSKRQQLESQFDGEESYLEIGPPLLGALGKSWQKFILLLENSDIYNPEFVHAEQGIPEDTSILITLQNHLLRMPEGNNHNNFTYRDSDHSIQFHSCHSSLREVQVLQDFLLDQFNQNPDLLPSEILVVCPQVQNYSALIKSVFDNPESNETKIPYGICDRQWRNESRIIDTFFNLLEFAEGRATARDFYSLISRPAICQKFELDESELEIIRWWIDKTNIAWGFDLDHKKTLDLPELEENTWQNALDRMFIGFCSGNSTSGPFENIVPFDEVEGSRVELFSKLVSIIDSLKKLAQKCSKKHQPSDWQILIEDFLINEYFVDDENNHKDLTELRKSLSILTNESNEKSEQEPLPVIRFHLERTLNDKSLFSRHLTSGVTFCSLRSARGIPAKIICHLGLNGGIFPSPLNRPSFDLCKLKPVYTDRNQAEEDRLLIMESILSCRQTLFFSFHGQSSKNNEKIPPSIVIDEIIEQLDLIINFSENDSCDCANDAFLFHHPLQPFGKNYFKQDGSTNDQDQFIVNKRPRSFSKLNCEAALSLASERLNKKPFHSEPLTSQGELEKKLDLAEIVDFWRGPSLYFINKRLGISIIEKESLLPENERLDVNPLEDSSIKRKMIQKFIDERKDSENQNSFYESLYKELKKTGYLPPEKLGKALNDSLLGEVQVIVNRDPVTLDGESTFFTGSAKVGNYEIEGKSSPIYNDAQLLFFASKLKGKNCMEGLVKHLWINSTSEYGGKIRTIISGKDMGFLIPARDSTTSSEQLCKLIELFFEGLTRPLPFFPNSSFAWLERTQKQRDKKPKKGEKSPQAMAESVWEHEDYGERSEFGNQLCFPYNVWEEESTLEMNELMMKIIDMDSTFLR